MARLTYCQWFYVVCNVVILILIVFRPLATTGKEDKAQDTARTRSRAIVSRMTSETNNKTSTDSSNTISLVRSEEKVKVSISNQTLEIHTLQVADTISKLGGGQSDALNVLFLHSGRFTSQNWANSGTLDLVADQGYRAVAIDLPGKGSSDGPIDRALFQEFIAALIKSLNLNKLVIVSPSSSGRYTLPYLFQDGKSSHERAVGFVPIAPGGTQDFRDQYPQSKIQTLIVYGTQDPEGPTTLEDLKLLPNSEILPIEGAGHPCYLEQPEVFHEALIAFLKKISS